jgi:hypothetical protein
MSESNPPVRTKTELLHDRMDKSLEAIATFARIGEEFKMLRKAAATSGERERVDQLIKLNTDTMAAVKRGLMLTEDDIGRSERRTPSL